jgi:hypothetical protein
MFEEIYKRLTGEPATGKAEIIGEYIRWPVNGGFIWGKIYGHNRPKFTRGGLI